MCYFININRNILILKIANIFYFRFQCLKMYKCIKNLNIYILGVGSENYSKTTIMTTTIMKAVVVPIVIIVVIGFLIYGMFQMQFYEMKLFELILIIIGLILIIEVLSRLYYKTLPKNRRDNIFCNIENIDL